MAKRECGGCNLCCKLVPVRSFSPEERGKVLEIVEKSGGAIKAVFEDFNKPAGQWCQHAIPGGCGIYAERPGGCRGWNCFFIAGKHNGLLRRPDKAGFVVDTIPDYITITTTDGINRRHPALQIWIDDRRPISHRDSGLRRLLAKGNLAGIVRRVDGTALILYPPGLSPDRKWHEMPGKCDGEEHDPNDALALGMFKLRPA